MFTVDHRQMMLQFPHDSRALPMERKWKSTATTGVELAPTCPRCASTNTKFCYYNNYSLSQPRYFCKGCRRYWTKGGSLRNVPVGGGCRKSRRAKSSRGAVSTNYGKNFNDMASNSSCLSGVNSVVQESGSTVDDNGSEIDLAVVFAKFLNQESSCNRPEIVALELADDEPSDQELINVTNSLSPVDNDHAVLECLNLTYQIQESNNLLDGLVAAGSQAQQLPEDRETIQEMIMENQEINEFGLQNFPGDEIVQDDLWNEAETSFSNGTWQLPEDQVQALEFDSVSVDNQLNVSANLISDNSWSCFDLSAGFEVFSRHY